MKLRLIFILTEYRIQLNHFVYPYCTPTQVAALQRQTIVSMRGVTERSMQTFLQKSLGTLQEKYVALKGLNICSIFYTHHRIPNETMMTINFETIANNYEVIYVIKTVIKYY
jgi:hypothetical protein